MFYFERLRTLAKDPFHFYQFRDIAHKTCGTYQDNCSHVRHYRLDNPAQSRIVGTPVCTCLRRMQIRQRCNL